MSFCVSHLLPTSCCILSSTASSSFTMTFESEVPKYVIQPNAADFANYSQFENPEDIRRMPQVPWSLPNKLLFSPMYKYAFWNMKNSFSLFLLTSLGFSRMSHAKARPLCVSFWGALVDGVYRSQWYWLYQFMATRNLAGGRIVGYLPNAIANLTGSFTVSRA